MSVDDRAPLQTWLVGGAVRDALLGLPVGDRDHVVVGVDAARMLAAGFRQVGRDFPVFLHPHTGEEYALARTERKSARGHTGFIVHADPRVTLEDDLRRRDFTINAIAQGADGRLIDPFGGIADLHARVLRHVGPAFVEDPLRVLRAARFMARLAPLGFAVAPTTLALMREMAASGELAALSPERVWQELRRALASARPSAFLRALRDCGALATVLPEVDALYGIPQRPQHHPEIDAGLHVEMACDMAARLAPGEDRIGFATLTHDLGKATTPRHLLPAHDAHAHRGLEPLARLAKRLKTPAEYHALARIACQEHTHVHRLETLDAGAIHDLLLRADGFRKPDRIRQLAIVCEADSRGRAGMQDTDYPQARRLIRLHRAALGVRGDRLPEWPSLRGPQFGEAMQRARIAAIAAAGAGGDERMNYAPS